VKALEALRDELKTWPRFEHVQLDSAWIHKLEALLDFGRMAVAILAALLSFALIAITFNTIRLQILTRREEIEVAKLIGATDAFIRRPFLYFGLTQDCWAVSRPGCWWRSACYCSTTRSAT